jgi:hypothetical protein
MQTKIGITILYNPAPKSNIVYQIRLVIYSPRHRYVCQPSLQLRWKEGEGKNCHCEEERRSNREQCMLSL